MSFTKRVYNIISGLIMIMFGVFLFIDTEDGMDLVIAALVFTLIIYGLKQTLYFFTMARHMVGGRMILYRGVIILDIGLFMLLTLDDPSIYVALYLIGGLALSGAIAILKGLEAKKLQIKSCNRTIFYGIVKIIIAGFSLFHLNSYNMLVYIFAVGVVFSALTRIAEALRKSAIIFVQ